MSLEVLVSAIWLLVHCQATPQLFLSLLALQETVTLHITWRYSDELPE